MVVATRCCRRAIASTGGVGVAIAVVAGSNHALRKDSDACQKHQHQQRQSRFHKLHAPCGVKWQGSTSYLQRRSRILDRTVRVGICRTFRTCATADLDCPFSRRLFRACLIRIRVRGRRVTRQPIKTIRMLSVTILSSINYAISASVSHGERDQ